MTIEYLQPGSRPFLELSEGWCSTEELNYLYEHVWQHTQNGGTALNIGCYKGLSCSAISLACENVCCIDVFEPSNSTPEVDRVATAARWFENMERLKLRERISLMVMPSYMALPILLEAGQVFDFIFVDASHEYQDVLTDIRYCERMLEPGGEIVLDDFVGNHPGIRKAALEVGGYTWIKGTKMASKVT